jgi:hypothetical protein
LRDFLQYANCVKTGFLFQFSSSSMQDCLVSIVDFTAWYLLYRVSSGH